MDKIKDVDKLVNPHVKIQFEINSQLSLTAKSTGCSCESSRKNTI